jgi:hypothetical protein
VLSSCFIILKEDPGVIHFGDHVRVMCLPDLIADQLFLQSVMMNPQRNAKFSRYQEVSFARRQGSSTLWEVEYPGMKERFFKRGEPVCRGQPVLLRHVNTGHHLGSDLIKYENDFGVEFEVYTKTQTTNNKYQNVYSEKEGRSVGVLPKKMQTATNEWLIL